MSEKDQRDYKRAPRCGLMDNKKLYFGESRGREKWKTVDEIIMMTVMRRNVTGLVLNKIVSSLR